MANIEEREWKWTRDGNRHTFIYKERVFTHQVDGSPKEIARVLFDQFMRQNQGEYGPFWIDKLNEGPEPEIWMGFNVLKPELPEEFMNEMKAHLKRLWKIKAFW